MDHDAKHPGGHPRPSELSLAHPSHSHTARLSEIEFLQRAARHIRLRTHDERSIIAGGRNGSPAPGAAAARDAVSGSPDVDAAR